MKGIQFIGIVVSFYLLSQTLLNYRRGNYTLRKASFFSTLWVLTAVLFVYPPLAELALPVLSTQDIYFSVLVVGLIVMFVLVSELYQQIGKLEGRFERLVQNLAVDDYVKRVSGESKDVEKRR